MVPLVVANLIPAYLLANGFWAEEQDEQAQAQDVVGEWRGSYFALVCAKGYSRRNVAREGNTLLLTTSSARRIAQQTVLKRLSVLNEHGKSNPAIKR
jgi:hypothetical protein